MAPSRFVLTDRQWLAIEPLCPGSSTAPGRTGRDTRLFLEAVLWVVRTNAPWRDLYQTRIAMTCGTTGAGQSS